MDRLYLEHIFLTDFAMNFLPGSKRLAFSNGVKEIRKWQVVLYVENKE